MHAFSCGAPIFTGAYFLWVPIILIFTVYTYTYIYEIRDMMELLAC